MNQTSELERPEQPAAHALGHVETPDGFSLRYAVYRQTESAPQGTILLLHGRNEAIEKYAETIGDLGKAGFDVATFDWRGQGGSDRFYANRELGYVDDFAQYASDLETIFSEVVLPDCRPPFFIVAHSTGALVALYAAPALVNRVRRMVLSSPLLDIPGSPFRRWLARFAARTLRLVGLGNVYVAGGPARKMRKPFEGNHLTSDPERYARNLAAADREPHLLLGGPTAAWTAAMFEAVDHVKRPEHLAATVIPTLIVMGGADRIVSNAAISAHAQRLRSASLLTIDGARHEMMQEADFYRDQFLAALRSFIPGTADG